MSYSSVLPLAQKANGQYNSNDTVDFVLDFMGREILPQTIRISGTLVATKADAQVAGNEAIYLDSKVGAHALFQQYITSLPSTGNVIENFQHVPRWVAMHTAAQQSKEQTGSGIDSVCELKCPIDGSTAAQLGKVGGKSFSIKPWCALTHSVNNISYSKTGQIKLTCLLSSAFQVLWGEDVDATCDYYITDLRLDYMTAADTMQPVLMTRVSSIKQTLTSSNQQLTLLLPISSSSLTMSFCNLAQENTATVKYTKLELVPDVTRVEFSFNDIVSGSMITFALEDKPEITLNALGSMDSFGKFDLLQTLFREEQGQAENYLIGTTFGDIMLANVTKFGVNIQSSVQAATAMAAYLYFKGVMTL